MTLSVLSGTSAEVQNPSVRLVVAPGVLFPKFVETPKDFKAGTLYMMVFAKLYAENCGTTAITIPTRILPDGVPSESGTINSRGVNFRAAYGGKHAGKKVQPSQVAFQPVTLQPGELAEVGLWEPKDGYRDVLPDELHDVTFVYEVAEDLATRFGWWSGRLEAKCNYSELVKGFKKVPQPVQVESSRS